MVADPATEVHHMMAVSAWYYSAGGGSDHLCLVLPLVVPDHPGHLAGQVVVHLGRQLAVPATV